MAEIEQRPLAVLARVAHDDGGLRGAADRDGPVAGRAARHDGRMIGLAPVEERRVIDEPVFDHLGIAGAKLARRQRVENGGVGDHQARLMEGPDQILAVDRIDAGLAANRAVDLGEQARGDLHEAHAAPHDGGGKTGQISNDATAQRDHEIAALDAGGEDGLAGLRQVVPALGGLAGREDML